jgi:hypothetical protein
MNALNSYLKVLNSLDVTKVCYIKQIGSKFYFQQTGKCIESDDIYFDIKRPGFLSPRMIQHNSEVINKLLFYENDHLISMTPTKNGFYCQVFSKSGKLVYAQYITYFSTNWLQTKYLQHKYPELVLKIKRLD